MSPVRHATAERLQARLASEQSERRLPSVVAGVVRHGTLAWSGSAGLVGTEPPTPGTQYRIGSITKTFVAVTVLRLRDEGRLDLADPVGRHLPGVPAGEATVAQLLSHSAGLPAETAGPWWERTPGGPWPELLATLDAPVTRHRPGRRFHYSNVGYAVLGELVARLRGAAWSEVVATEILGPLGMARTTTRPTPPSAQGFAVHPWADVLLPEPEHDAGAMAPAGQLWSTIDDLARYATFLAGDTDGVLDRDTLEEMREARVLDDRPGEPWTAAYGLGLQVFNDRGRRSVGHGGSMPGFLALLRIDVESSDAAIVATNTTAGLTGELVTDLLEILASEEPVSPPVWRPSPVPPGVLELTGIWYWGPAPLRIRALTDGWLELAPLDGGGRASRFRPEEGGTWTGLDGYYAGETLRVLEHADGTVSCLDLASFVLTRTPYDATAEIPGGVDRSGWR